jgi:hypothetical protein
VANDRKSPGIDSRGDGRATSKRGGRRPGAGRPRGSKDVLPRGSVAAIKVANLRVPADATPEQAALADVCQQRIIDVMMEDVGSVAAFSVLTAAKTLREEVCGKVAEKHEHSGTITHAHLVAEASK